MTPSPELFPCLRRLSLAGIAVAVLGSALCVVGYSTAPMNFDAAYVTAFAYWLGLSLGCLAIAMLHGLTGGAWGRAIRRVVEAGYETLPLMAVLFAPIWIRVGRIYPWADAEFVQRHESVAKKAGYLNVTDFHDRAVIYFALWIAIVCSLDIFSPNDDRDADSLRGRRLQKASGVGLILYGFTFTLAAVDWLMSLEPEWYSTMYALIHIAGQALSGLAFALVAVISLGKFAPWSSMVTPRRLSDLSGLLLASVMLWAYFAFFEYLVVWNGNLPEENVWYVHRSRGGWQYLAAGLTILNFALPFLLLLSRRMKQRPATVCRIAVLLLVMRYVDLFWTIMPGFQRDGASADRLTFHWLDLVAFATVGGLWLAVFARRLSVRIRLPLYDPIVEELVDERSGQAALT